jgi:8-oxo-dGTP diphosphatase
MQDAKRYTRGRGKVQQVTDPAHVLELEVRRVIQVHIGLRCAADQKSPRPWPVRVGEQLDRIRLAKPADRRATLFPLPSHDDHCARRAIAILTMMKRVKESVAVVIRNRTGEFLVTRRPDDPGDHLAGVWGFPAVTRRDGEAERAAAERIGPLKLGVTLSVGAKLGERAQDRGGYLLRLSDYDASIVDGAPSVPQSDDSVTQYVACEFTSDPAVLVAGARRGSVCAQIFLEVIGLDWS